MECRRGSVDSDATVSWRGVGCKLRQRLCPVTRILGGIRLCGADGREKRGGCCIIGGWAGGRRGGVVGCGGRGLCSKHGVNDLWPSQSELIASNRTLVTAAHSYTLPGQTRRATIGAELTSHREDRYVQLGGSAHLLFPTHFSTSCGRGTWYSPGSWCAFDAAGGVSRCWRLGDLAMVSFNRLCECVGSGW